MRKQLAKQEQHELESHSSTYALGSILTMQVKKLQTLDLIQTGLLRTDQSQ